MIALLILIRVLVYGEPVTPTGSEENTRYWRHLNQAQCDMDKGEPSCVQRIQLLLEVFEKRTMV